MRLDGRNFERLLRRVAQRVDGLVNVRFYGVPGQRQHGIDIVGWDDSGAAVVLQAKNVDSFGESEFDDAVATFKSGRRPFSPVRLVIGVALSGRRTQLIDRLANAETLLGISVSLYDSDHLDDVLRSHPAIVAEFFGAEAAQRFCPGFQAPDSAAPRIDAVARAFSVGPVRALNLEHLEEQAQQISDPGLKAVALLDLADRLEGGGWEPNARAYRRLARGLLTQAVQSDGSVQVAEELADLAMAEALGALFLGDASSARPPSQTIAGLIGGNPFPPLATVGDPPGPPLANIPEWQLRASALFSVADSFREPYPGLSGSLSHARDVVSDLTASGDGASVRLAIVAGELTIAAEDLPFRPEILDLLEARASELLHGPENQHQLGARLACVVAEMRGEWVDLVGETRRSRYEAAASALIMARYPRWSVLTNQVDEGLLSWSEAIRWAGEADLPNDAANWMRCIVDAAFGTGRIWRGDSRPALNGRGFGTVRWGPQAPSRRRARMAPSTRGSSRDPSCTAGCARTTHSDQVGKRLPGRRPGGEHRRKSFGPAA